MVKKTQTKDFYPIDIRLFSRWKPENTEVQATLHRDTKGLKEFIVRMFPKGEKK